MPAPEGGVAGISDAGPTMLLVVEDRNFLRLFLRTRRSAPRAEEGSMRIRAGYEISYDCPQPTPMILTLSVHPSRMSDLLTADRMRLDPPIPAKTYHDSFGNFCHVIRAPPAG